MHSWQSNDGTAWVAGGSHDQLIAMTGAGICYDLTPDDLAAGREDAAVNTGYGFGFYGTGYFGQPRAVTSDSVPQEATTWQLDNFGQNLVGLHQDDGRIWEWDLTTTVGANLVTNGAFASDANWNKGVNWSISGGVAEYKQQTATFAADNTVIGTQTFVVTVVNVSGQNKYAFNGAVAPVLSLVRGVTYTFDMSDNSNSGHPLAFKNGSTAYTTGVTTTGTAGASGASVVIAVDAAAPASGLLYYCTVHGNAMGAAITTSANTAPIDYSTETITATAHGFSNGDEVTYITNAGSQAAIGGLTSGTNYFVVSAATNSLKLAATSGGTAINLTAPISVTIDGSSGSVVVLATNKIVISNTFTNGDKVVYSNGNGTDITGLVNGTEYFIVGASSSEFQLAATSGGAAIALTALGTGTAHSFTKRLGATHELKRVNFGVLDQTVGSLVVSPDTQDSYDVTVDLVDPNDDSNAATVPNVKVKVTGTTTNTVSVHETLVVGTNTFRFGADDTAVKIEIIPQAYDTPNFDIDNISLKKKTVAVPIVNAPINNKGIVVTEERFIFALGSGGNSRRVSWCDKENNTQWTPAATNEAGDIELATSGQIMCGVRTRGVTLIITDTDAHMAQYIAPPYVYSFQRIGTNCGAVSRLSVVATDQGAFWYGQENFHYFDGNSVQTLKCDVHDYVFNDFNQAQQSKVWGMVNGANNEIWWFYCSAGSTEIDRYVAYDFKDNHWLIGNLSRTSGVSRGVFAYPFMAKHGTKTDIMNHELGFNYEGSSIFCETGPVSIGSGDQVAKVTEVITDEKTQGDVDLKFKTKFNPNDTERTFGPFNPSNPTSVRFTGRQVKMRVEGDQATDWRVGVMRLEVKAGGRR
ncbi:hypothetical protein N8630_02645 [Synechococcus sp. AH-601-C19]|nr:hypothetical protein [Synechococcus sp. AH-601-C19]